MKNLVDPIPSLCLDGHYSEETIVSKAREFRIKRAMERDVPVILKFIRELAEYEKLSHEVIATEESLRESLFGPRPVAEVIIGYAGTEPAVFAVFFHNYSTFLGRPGLYVEDLFVSPEWRGRGLGRRLLAYVANLAVTRAAAAGWNGPCST